MGFFLVNAIGQQTAVSTHVYLVLPQCLHFLCHLARAMVDEVPVVALKIHPAREQIILG